MNAAAQFKDGPESRVHPLTPVLVPAAKITVSIEGLFVAKGKTNFRQVYTIRLVVSKRIRQKKGTISKVPDMRIPHPSGPLCGFVDIPLDDDSARSRPNGRENHIGDLDWPARSGARDFDYGCGVRLVLESFSLTRDDAPCLADDLGS
jgi:hypothetical protein